ncbi:MAG: glycosyltransferase family 4 protein [Desulfobulbaceae bacterium]|nr:glycosyltransferase family 4 protein [Desulfobulbaceae bacterium]
MQILHFILGKANKNRANGVNQVIAGLAKYSVRQGAEVRVIGKAESVNSEGELIVRDGFDVQAFSTWGKPLTNAIRDAIAWADIIHMHGGYAPWNVWVGHKCNRMGTPYILTLHDGLSPRRTVVHGRIKKLLFHTFIQARHLREAAAIHVLTEEEATEVLSCANPKAMFCIPNGIDLDDFPPIEETMFREKPYTTIGYLGRLSQEKNLNSLCEAFTAVNTEGSLRLKLAGPDSSYARKLLRQFGERGVEWVGPKFGQEKVEFIRSIDLFVLPSLSEGFSMAALEVLAFGVPLLITRTSKMCYFYDCRAFFMCEPTAFGIELGLRGALAQRSEWPGMTMRGRELIEQRLNWAVLTCELLKQYRKILSVGKA